MGGWSRDLEVSLCFTRGSPFGGVQGSLSDLLGLRLPLPLQGQGRAVSAREKVSGTFILLWGLLRSQTYRKRFLTPFLTESPGTNLRGNPGHHRTSRALKGKHSDTSKSRHWAPLVVSHRKIHAFCVDVGRRFYRQVNPCGSAALLYVRKTGKGSAGTGSSAFAGDQGDRREAPFDGTLFAC